MFIHTHCSLFLFSVLITVSSVVLENEKCPKNLAVNVTKSNNDDYYHTADKHIRLYDEHVFTVDGQLKGCICNVTKCIRKCCAPNKKFIVSLEDENKCSNTGVDLEFDIYRGIENANNISKDQLYFIHGYSSCDGVDMVVSPDFIEDDKFYVQENGSVYIPSMEMVAHQSDFCIDIMDVYDIKNTFGVVVCLPADDEKLEDEGKSVAMWQKLVGMIISMPFLLATFIVYALLPERNLHMKALMSYVFTLMLAYMLLVTIQMHATFPTVPCRIMGYSCLFFFIVSFYWMNVICIDIWLAFSGVRGYSGRKSSERKRFLYYCLYAWGMSILHVLVVLIIDLSAKPNASYHPGIGSGQCFLKNRYPELLYLYFPVGLLICINITMFALTAYKIRKVKQDTKMLKKNESQKHSYENDKQRFNLYLKLLLAMGVNWSMEIISWAVNWQLGYESVYAWYATDFCNAAYGVVIFFIFVFKRSIWKMLQKRYYSFIGKPHLAHSNTTTQTRSTSYSTAATTVHEMHPTSMGASERLMDH